MKDLTMDTVVVLYHENGATRIELHIERSDDGDNERGFDYVLTALVNEITIEGQVNTKTEVVKDETIILSEDEVLAWISEFLA